MIRTEVINFINSLNNENLNLLLGYLENIYVEMCKKSNLNNYDLFGISYYNKLKINFNSNLKGLLQITGTNGNHKMDLNYLIELINYVRNLSDLSSNINDDVKELLDNSTELKNIRWLLIKLKEKYNNYSITDTSLKNTKGGLKVKLSNNELRKLLDLEIISQGGYNNRLVYRINNDITNMLNYIYSIKPLENVIIFKPIVNNTNNLPEDDSIVNKLINKYGLDTIKNYIYDLFNTLKLDINPTRKTIKVDYILFKPDYDNVNNNYYNICTNKLMGRLLQSHTTTLKVNDKYVTCYKVSINIVKDIISSIELASIRLDSKKPKNNLNKLIKLGKVLESNLK